MTKEEAASVLQNYIVDDLKFSNRGLNIAYEIKCLKFSNLQIIRN